MLKVLAALVLLASPLANAQSGACDQRINPHSFACHHAGFTGAAGFPLMKLDWFGSMQGSWSAVTYATQTSNSGAGFMMDFNAQNPRRPGRGVFNLFRDGQTSQLSDLFISGESASFSNWQNQPATLQPGSLTFADEGTVEFQFLDLFGAPQFFRCRIFQRNATDHLNCQWFSLVSGNTPDARWRHVGYFGFLKRSR